MAADKIVVKSRTDRGRWRAGRHFTREGVTLDAAELEDSVLEALRADPELTIQPALSDKTPDELALAREVKATKSAAGKKTWAQAELAARKVAGLDEAPWTELPPAERIAKIEAQLSEAK